MIPLNFVRLKMQNIYLNGNKPSASQYKGCLRVRNKASSCYINDLSGMHNELKTALILFPSDKRQSAAIS